MVGEDGLSEKYIYIYIYVIMDDMVYIEGGMSDACQVAKWGQEKRRRKWPIMQKQKELGLWSMADRQSRINQGQTLAS